MPGVLQYGTPLRIWSIDGTLTPATGLVYVRPVGKSPLFRHSVLYDIRIRSDQLDGRYPRYVRRGNLTWPISFSQSLSCAVGSWDWWDPHGPHLYFCSIFPDCAPI